MARIQVSLSKQKSDFHFLARNASGHTVEIDDATAYEEGRGHGVGPMQLLVMAIGGCSGVDVMSILKKSRQHVTRFDIEVVGEKPDGDSPAIFFHIHISYDLEGDIQASKAQRAIELSLGKYCSVAATLKMTARITYDYRVNGQLFRSQSSLE